MPPFMLSFVSDDSDNVVSESVYTPPSVDQHASSRYGNRVTISMIDPPFVPASRKSVEQYVHDVNIRDKATNKAAKVSRMDDNQGLSAVPPTQKSYSAILHKKHQLIANEKSAEVKTKSTSATTGMEKKKDKQSKSGEWSMAGIKNHNFDTGLPNPTSYPWDDPNIFKAHPSYEDVASAIDLCSPKSMEPEQAQQQDRTDCDRLGCWGCDSCMPASPSINQEYRNKPSITCNNAWGRCGECANCTGAVLGVPDNAEEFIDHYSSGAPTDHSIAESIEASPHRTTKVPALLRCGCCSTVFNYPPPDYCPACGAVSLQYTHATAAEDVSDAEPESEQSDWDTPTALSELREASLSQDAVSEPLAGEDATDCEHIAAETALNAQSYLMKAFATLGLDGYSSVDYETLQRHYKQLHGSAITIPNHRSAYSKAFITIVKHHDTHDCWKLCLIWTAQLDQKLMELKDLHAPDSWGFLAQELDTTVTDCKERFNIIKRKDWKSKSAVGVTEKGGQKKKQKPIESSSIDTHTPEVCWGPPALENENYSWPSAAFFKKSSRGPAVCETMADGGDPWGATRSPSPGISARSAPEEHLASGWTSGGASIPKPQPPVPTSYSVTYWATIESGNDVLSVPIDGNNVSGPEKTIVDSESCSLKKVWKWVQEKGLGDKVNLHDAFDLAKDLQGEAEKEDVERGEKDITHGAETVEHGEEDVEHGEEAVENDDEDDREFWRCFTTCATDRSAGRSTARSAARLAAAYTGSRRRREGGG